jgi:hypothetical protein
MSFKNVLVANFKEDKKLEFKHDRKRREGMDNLVKLIKAQIKNSLLLGWEAEDIILVTNFDFEFMGVKATYLELNKKCLTGSKMYAVKEILERDLSDIIWAHDLDAWQNVWFDCPEFLDVGACEYSRPKFNGGSVFWRKSSLDMVDEIIKRIEEKEQAKEEPTLDAVFKSDEYKDRVTVLNPTYNVGCSGFVKRYKHAIKPIKVCHLHPTNRIAWETHCLDRNGTNFRSISSRLEVVLREHWVLAQELSEEGASRRREHINLRLKSGEHAYA